jgi:hypothetical protein
VSHTSVPSTTAIHPAIAGTRLHSVRAAAAGASPRANLARVPHSGLLAIRGERIERDELDVGP